MPEPREIHSAREKMRDESRERFVSLFTLAGFKIERTWELANGYWPLHPDYDDSREPWWLFLTDKGLVQIGWRKRVISIDWSATTIRKIVTTRDVTKGDDHVHAYSIAEALECLTELHR